MHGLHHRPSQDPRGEPRPNECAPHTFRDPLSIVLVVVVVVALGVAALLGGELYARHRATSMLEKVVECVAEDRASVSFGARPMLLQLTTGNFPDISIETAGNQFREAKGMKVDLRITDLRLPSTANSRGTLGSLDADIFWSNEGMKQTLQDTIPLFGGLMTAVTTKPSDGTIELHGGLGSITARPQVTDGVVALHVLSVTGFAFTLPPESVQPPLDVFTSIVTKSLPSGIHADSLQLTDTGMTARFSTRHANIALAQADPCFAGL
jgi:DUF2993 family protein